MFDTVDVDFLGDRSSVSIRLVGPFEMRVSPSGEAFIHGALELSESIMIHMCLPVANLVNHSDCDIDFVESLRTGVLRLGAGRLS